MTLSLCLHLSSSVSLSVPVMSKFVYTRMHLFVYLPLSPFHSLPTYISIFISLPLYLSLPFSLSPISPSLHHLSLSPSLTLSLTRSLILSLFHISLLSVSPSRSLSLSLSRSLSLSNSLSIVVSLSLYNHSLLVYPSHCVLLTLYISLFSLSPQLL